ncbi:hypothetical protein LEP1GSC202_0397 [Leptospira yanagawae serovar Saopaulo str. Sao Paulo = ATCC 700523]|uniref:Uncharacterized protein n=1 Tax=Leptospira yanagawae serovar Saopaulo str. Sao Paulo = ATCC 700523 TaxID=1249483 RepID=A0A5E8HFN7_9LEPT|nr:hypothetical protein LEP1GSC202_0397 [Leptospira yanagawae serovar Saopaulo str. Sao Paulo = ATCC 700523]
MRSIQLLREVYLENIKIRTSFLFSRVFYLLKLEDFLFELFLIKNNLI